MSAHALGAGREATLGINPGSSNSYSLLNGVKIWDSVSVLYT